MIKFHKHYHDKYDKHSWIILEQFLALREDLDRSIRHQLVGEYKEEHDMTEGKRAHEEIVSVQRIVSEQGRHTNEAKKISSSFLSMLSSRAHKTTDNPRA